MGCCHGQGEGGWALHWGRLAEEVRRKRQTWRHRTGSMVQPWEPEDWRITAWSLVLSWRLILNTLWCHKRSIMHQTYPEGPSSAEMMGAMSQGLWFYAGMSIPGLPSHLSLWALISSPVWDLCLQRKYMDSGSSCADIYLRLWASFWLFSTFQSTKHHLLLTNPSSSAERDIPLPIL